MVGIKILVGKGSRIYDIEVEEEDDNNYTSALLEEERTKGDSRGFVKPMLT